MACGASAKAPAQPGAVCFVTDTRRRTNTANPSRASKAAWGTAGSIIIVAQDNWPQAAGHDGLAGTARVESSAKRPPDVCPFSAPLVQRSVQ